MGVTNYLLNGMILQVSGRLAHFVCRSHSWSDESCSETSFKPTNKKVFVFVQNENSLVAIHCNQKNLHSVTKDLSINFGMNLCWWPKKRNKHPFWTPLRKQIFKTFKNKIGSSNAIFRLHHAASQTDDTQVFVDVFGYLMFPAEKKKNVYRPSKLINMIHLKMGRCLEF